MTEFRIFRGTGEPRVIGEFPAEPPWRSHRRPRDRGATYSIDPAHPEIVDVINAAIHLRRPLLVTGKPGVGKSTLAYRIAYELGLGKVLVWPINTRSTLKDALYSYDAIGRLQATPPAGPGMRSDPPEIGGYITLGPLGTALLPCDRPRVLLVDEIDKGDIDLSSDLLHVFEEGFFEIPELRRALDVGSVTRVKTWDAGSVEIGSHIASREFPIVVMTSNGEREFPPAFKRRCLPLLLPEPDSKQLERIVEQHFEGDPEALLHAKTLIQDFLARQRTEDLATDQLLNAVALALRGADVKDGSKLRGVLLEALGPKNMP